MWENREHWCCSPCNAVANPETRSENVTRTCQMTQRGWKFATGSIRSGLVAKNYSNASTDVILIFRSGMDVLWRALLSEAHK
jgi:hypothetical protein